MIEGLSEQERIVLRKALDAYQTRELPMDRHTRAVRCTEQAIARDLSLRLT